jgi:hypothetical protein
MCWDRDSKKILLACKDGKLHEITVPKPADCDIKETYLRPFSGSQPFGEDDGEPETKERRPRTVAAAQAD